MAFTIGLMPGQKTIRMRWFSWETNQGLAKDTYRILNSSDQPQIGGRITIAKIGVTLSGFTLKSVIIRHPNLLNLMMMHITGICFTTIL